MTQKVYIRNILIAGLVCLSLGGWLLHMKIHPVSENPANYVAFLSGIFSIIILPIMFLNRKTIHYAYMLNGFTVIIGTITMAHFSLAHLPAEFGIKTILIKTTLPDIFMLFGKFFAGKAIFDLEFMSGPDALQAGKLFRYPTLSWWGVHFVSVSIVYYLGHILW